MTDWTIPTIILLVLIYLAPVWRHHVAMKALRWQIELLQEAVDRQIKINAQGRADLLAAKAESADWRALSDRFRADALEPTGMYPADAPTLSTIRVRERDPRETP